MAVAVMSEQGSPKNMSHSGIYQCNHYHDLKSRKQVVATLTIGHTTTECTICFFIILPFHAQW